MVIVRRVKPLPYWIIPIIALLAGIAVSTIILYILAGASPAAVFSAIAYGFTRPGVIAKIFVALTIVGIALLVSFKGSIWNIGGEGQITFGMMAAAWVALFTMLPYINPGLAQASMIILAMIAGGFWALLAALPRAYLGLDEVPVTLIMNYIAYYIVDLLVYGPWRGSSTHNYPRTDTIPSQAMFPQIPGTTMTWDGLFLLIITFIGVWYLLRNTSIGLRIKILGNNPNLLRSSGINVPLTIILALTISGLIAGSVGALYLGGDVYHIGYPIESQTANYGYTGILVAWLSMLELIAVPLAAYIVSALYEAGIKYQTLVGGNLGGMLTSGTSAIVDIFIGSILLLYTILITFSEYKIKIIIER
ncbi:MAG: ABC transporter permease [Crenarchaeota archaeon]|nr:ABC transporter permease [Thermoproteota archaeon]